MGRRLGAIGLIIALFAGLVALWRGLGTPEQGLTGGAMSEGSETVKAPVDGARMADAHSEEFGSDTDRTVIQATPLDSNPIDAAELFRVHVLGLDGEPVEGASVWISRRRREPALLTDHEGVAHFPMPPEREYYELSAEHGDKVAVPIRVASTPGSATLHLLPTESLMGRVLSTATEAPIPNAEVRLRQNRTYLDLRTTSDGAGRIDFERVPRGIQLQLWAAAPGYVPTTWQFGTHRDPNEPTPELEVRLEQAIVLSGTVVDAMTGAPVPGARVAAGPGPAMKSTNCNEFGEFSHGELITSQTREVHFRVEASGYCALEGRVESEDWSETVRIRLPPSARLRVHAFDAGGNPIEDARIFARLRHSLTDFDPPEVLRPWIDEGWTLSIDSLGAGLQAPSSRSDLFEIDRIPFSESIQVSASARGYQRATVPSGAAGAPGSIETLEIVLTEKADTASARIQGVMRVNGVPTPGQVTWASESIRSSRSTADDGSFNIKVTEPGTVILTPSPRPPGLGGLYRYFEKGGPFADQAVTVEVRAGETRDVDLDLQVPMGELSGRITTSGGRPIPGRSLRIESIAFPLHKPSTPLKWSVASCVTDTEGRFAIHVPTELAPYRIRFLHGSAIHAREIPSAPYANIEFELPETRRVSVRFDGTESSSAQSRSSAYVCPEGSTEYRRIEIDLDGSDRGRSHTSEDDEFEFELPLGTYDILIGRPGMNPARFEAVELTAAPTPYELFVRLEPTHRATFTLPEGSNPLPGGVVVLILEEDAWGSVQDPDQPGGLNSPYPLSTPRTARGLRLRGDAKKTSSLLAPGRYRFKVLPPDISIEPEWFEMPSRDTSLEIRWH